MKHTKRLAVLMWVLLLLIQAVPLAVSAAPQATITVASITANAGDTVDVPISITDVSDVVAIGMHVSYNKDILECVSASMSSTVASMDLANANIKPIGHENEVWLTTVSTSGKTLSGNILTITFKVKEDAPAGLAAINVENDGLSVVANPNYTAVAVTVTNGGIAVGGETDTPASSSTSTDVQETTTVGDVAVTTANPQQGNTTTSVKTTAATKRTTKATAAVTTTVKATNQQNTTTKSVATTVTQATQAPTKTTTASSDEVVTQAGQQDETQSPTDGTTQASKQTAVDQTTVSGTTTDTTVKQGDTTKRNTTTKQGATTITQKGGTTTTKQGDTTAVDQATASTTASTTAATVVSPNGDTVEITDDTAVDIHGAVVTAVDGKPSMVQTVAVMISDVVGTPEQTVTVTVALSEVKELTALGLALRYDPAVMTFEGGECVGFLKGDAAMTNVAENKRGTVDISFAHATGVSGQGDIAQLRFQVNKAAINGDYRLSLVSNPLLQSDTVELPVKVVAGTLTVEGGAQSGTKGITVYTVVIVVTAAVLVTLVTTLVIRRKKRGGNVISTVVDISGDEE